MCCLLSPWNRNVNKGFPSCLYPTLADGFRRGDTNTLLLEVLQMEQLFQIFVTLSDKVYKKYCLQHTRQNLTHWVLAELDLSSHLGWKLQVVMKCFYTRKNYSQPLSCKAWGNQLSFSSPAGTPECSHYPPFLLHLSQNKLRCGSQRQAFRLL